MNQLRRWKNQPFVTITFLGIQVFVFLLAYLFPWLNIEMKGVMFGPYIVFNQEYWRLITPIFIHFGLMHIAVNSVVLYFMGSQVEALYGHLKFFLIYIFSGILGNLMSFAFNGPMVQSAGASTSLFGMFGAFVILGFHYKDHPVIQGMVRQFTLFIVMSLVFGFFDRSIDMWGHLGGLFGGMLLGNILGLSKNFRPFSIHTKILSAMVYIFLFVFFILYGFRKFQFM